MPCLAPVVMLPRVLFLLSLSFLLLKIHVLTQFVTASLAYKHRAHWQSNGYCVVPSRTVKITFIAKAYA